MSFKTFNSFYRFYLQEHSNPLCRYCHYIGLTLVIFIVAASFFTQHYYFLLSTPFAGYGFSWIGHYCFEKNKPASFSHPLYSFIADWRMFFDWLVSPLHTPDKR